MSAAAADVTPQGGSGTHSAGYLDGAPAADAFQALVDRGLLDQPSPAVPSPAASPPTGEQAKSVSTPQPEAAAATPEPAAAEPQAEEFTNLDEYLTKAGLDRASFLELPVTVKVDGAESSVPLSTLLRTYQTDAHVTQKSQALAENQRKWEGEQAAARQVLQQQVQTAATVAQIAHQQILHEFQNIPWEQLKVQDPQQYIIKRQELQERFGAIQTEVQRLGQVQQQQAAEAQQRQAQQFEAERSRMLDAFPEWRDPAKFQVAQKELISYAKNIGFNDAEISNILDHRYMKVLHDASRYAALQAKSPAVLKIVRAAPPMAAPGARTTRDPKAAQFQQARAAMRQSPRNEDAQLAAFSLLAERGA